MARSGYSGVLTIFLILFGGVAVYFVWNGFEFQQIFIGQTGKTTAKVESVVNAREGMHTAVQRIRYKFHVGEVWHNGFAKITGREGYVDLGDSLLIEYSESNPKKTEIVEYRSGSYVSHSFRFLSGKDDFVQSKSKSYKELVIVQSLFFLKTYGLGGKAIEELTGDVCVGEEKLVLKPFDLEDKVQGPYLPPIYFEFLGTNEVESLIQSESGEKFLSFSR